MFVYISIALLAILAMSLYSRLHYKRFRQFASIPQMQPSLLWGHLHTFETFSQSGPRDRHPGITPMFFYQPCPT